MKFKFHTSRRQFIKRSLAGAAGVIAMPTIVPSSVFGADAPSNKIHIGQIGCGRIANDMDMPGILRQDIARIVAVCDLDSNRLAKAKTKVEAHYNGAVTVKTFGDYRELLQDPGIDAVAISTPDFWHSEPVVAAALAGKDVYVQKPLSMTIHEGRQVSDIVTAKKRAFQIGSQQRSDSPWPEFRRACELVRNGRLGQLHTVKVGLPIDDAVAKHPEEMPVPPNLNYAMWLGWSPEQPYTEERVHPQADFGRPGWLRVEPYTLGMITAWGSHHVDVAHWGMDTELTGPLEIEGHAAFPKAGLLWNVHSTYHVEMKYANGVTMIIDNKFPNGVRFEGDEGWIFVTRSGGKVTASDPDTGNSKSFAASKPSIIKSEIKPGEIHLYKSADQHLNWLQSIQSRQRAATTPEIAHRSTSACEVAWISMKLGRKLRWNPDKEEFAGDDEANAMRSRPQRPPYGTDNVLKNA